VADAAIAAEGQGVLHKVGAHWDTWRKYLWPESGALSPNPALDGLRAVAALLVLLFHAWSLFPNYVQRGQTPSSYPLWYAKTGVILFFVLSGFLLFLPYAQWLFGVREQPSMLLFYKRRALRVIPAYWVSLLIIGVLIHPAGLQDILIHLGFLSNMNWYSTFSINGVYWTMAIEVQFYLILPLIALGMSALARRIGVKLAILAALAGLFALSVLSTYPTLMGAGDLVNTPVVSSFLVQYAAMPFWLGVFGCGIACSLIYTYATKVHQKNEAPGSSGASLWSQRSGNYALFGGVVLLVLLSTNPLVQALPMQQELFGLGYGFILFGVLFGSAILRWPLATPALRFLGLISYSFYIWHHAALLLVGYKLQGLLQAQYHTVVVFVVGLILTLPVAYLSYQFAERPFIMARRRAHESNAMNKQPVEATVQAAQIFPGGATTIARRWTLALSSVTFVAAVADWGQHLTQRVRQIGERRQWPPTVRR